jgi:hypothetical protein
LLFRFPYNTQAEIGLSVMQVIRPGGGVAVRDLSTVIFLKQEGECVEADNGRNIS